MKKLIQIMTICFLSFLFFFVGPDLKAQTNLVSNGGFEIYDTCPDYISQINRATNWYSSRLSPDYFNSCSPASSPVSEPSNYAGYHIPSSGNAYSGFYAGIAVSNAREYVGTELVTPMLIGTRYYISFKVSLAESYHFGNWCGVNKLGALFSTLQYDNLHNAPICNCAQIVSDSIITDTLNWIRIRGSFVADSMYSYMSIGRFAFDTSTSYIELGTGTECNAFYYIDDVCLSTDSLYSYNFIWSGIDENRQIKNISIFPNPTANYVDIKISNYSNPYSYSLHNVLGQVLFRTDNINTSNAHIDISDYLNGIYFLTIENDNKIINYKIIKQ